MDAAGLAFLQDEPEDPTEIAERQRRREEERQKARDAAHRRRILKLYKKILKKTAYPVRHVDALADMTRSDRVKLGVVSLKLYENIYSARKFDRYGQLVFKKKTAKDRLAERINKSLASQKKGGGKRKERKFLLTEEEDIPLKPQRFGPPGLANPLHTAKKSEGNELFYNYTGEWHEGYLHGFGTYIYVDGTEYEGEWHLNRRHGQGIARYGNGSVYTGYWEDDFYQGIGTHKMSDGTVYEGYFHKGVRQGPGRLTFPCGLIYEGDFYIGHPHGRGEMTSPELGIRYRGWWENGFIRGTGTLYTREWEEDVRPWPMLNGGLSIRAAYELKRREERDHHAFKVSQQARFKGKLNAMQLQEYVEEVRDDISNMRRAANLQEVTEKRRLMKEKRQREKEARLNALLAAQNDGGDMDLDLDSDDDD